MRGAFLIFLISYCGFVFGQFPSMMPHTHFLKINSLTEDTLNNKLHFQAAGVFSMPNRTEAGITTNNLAPLAPAAVYNTYTSSVSQGFSLLYSRQLIYSGNRLYSNDSAFINCINASNGNPIWRYNFNGGICRSMNLKGNSLIVVYDSLSSFLDIRIDQINTTTGAISSLCNWTTPMYGPNPFWYVMNINAAKILNNKLYLGGDFMVDDSLGNTLTNFAVFDLITKKILPCNLTVNGIINDIDIEYNKIYITGTFTTASSATRNRYAVYDTSFNLQPNVINFSNEVNQIEIYNNKVFALGRFKTINSTVVNPSGDYVVKGYDLATNSVLNWSLTAIDPVVYPYTPDTLTSNKNFNIIRNRLYVSGFATFNYGLNEYCLPPRMYGSISGPSIVCIPSGANVNYSISAALYAGSYVWSYSGTGAVLSFTNNNAQLNFSGAATGGVLKVFTQAYCGTKSDTLKLNIFITPRPNISASVSDDTLNCFKRKVKLFGNSITANVTYQWAGPYSYTSNLQNDSCVKNGSGNYTLTVTNTITSCTSNTIISIKIDTILPNVSLPTSSVNILCNPDSSLLNGSSTTTPSLIWWHLASSGVNHYNPYYTKNIGNYYMVVQNTYNGCKDSSTFSVGFAGVLPNKKLLSHTTPTTTIPIDTVTCIKTNVTVVGASDTLSTLLSWRSLPGGVPFPNPININTQGSFRLIVKRTDNGCVDSSLIIFISQNVTLPNLSISNANTNINCSSSTATLNAVTSPTNSAMLWSGPSSFSSPNPAITSLQGKYYVTSLRADNGCSKKDSVTVGYTPTLIINAGRDSVVCKNSNMLLSATAIGTVSGISYVWNPGGNGQNINVNPNITTNYIVSANSATCSGTDTVKITIPSDIQDSIVTTKNCNGTNAGSISIFAKGGIPPYKYSVNSSAFTSQSTYTNLAFGTYFVSIKDSIGCTLNTNATINQNSNLPVPVFIASTQNTKGDTIVLVDLTVPKADSVQWILPASATKIGGDMFNPIVVFADTGSFLITLKAFYANCTISTTKLIRVAPYDSTLATTSNNNGIKSLTLFPNPNNGVFTIQVEFSKKQNSSLQIWDAVGGKHFQQNYSTTDLITLPVNVSHLPNGTYIFKVIGEYNSKHLNFVISH